MSRPQSNIIFALSVVYVFFNSCLLPEGLYYTTLFTPFFLVALMRMGGLMPFSCFFFVTAVLIAFQAPDVEHWRDYLISFVLLQTVAVFILCLYYFLKTYSQLVLVFKYVAIFNAILLIPAIITLFIPFIRPVMWYEKVITQGVAELPRLKMFTFEASYYSLLLIPVMAYYGLKKFLFTGPTGILLVTLVLSYLISFSLGVSGGLIIAIFLVFLFNLKALDGSVNWHLIVMVVSAMVAILLLLYFFYPHNPLFTRLQNIYLGNDTSARGRTYESFHIAWKVIQQKSVIWGLGPGQFKFIGKDLLNYYYVLANTPSVARIPNAVAETLCIYGIAGLLIRFALIGYLFFKSKVWDNYYRLLLFLFIFIYQFTGSYLFNPAEYVIWTLSFSPTLLPQFNRKNLFQISKTTSCYESPVY